jgi:hypothetical protein
MRMSGSTILKTLTITAFWLVFMGFSVVKTQAQLGPPPTITAQPTGTNVTLLGTVILSARSKQGLTYQWLLNGQPISGVYVAVNLPYLLDASQTVSTLTLANVTTNGSYSLKVTDLGGSVTTTPANVTVSSLVGTVTNLVGIVTSATGKLTSGAFKLTLSVPVGSNIVVQATSDMVSWNSLSTNTATSSSLTFTDSAAATIPIRFYRARIQ